MFYVYVIIDPRTQEPIYVGKGSGNRMYQHGLPCEKWIESSDEDYIFWMETVAIAFLGRDSLCNRNAGGRWKEQRQRIKKKKAITKLVQVLRARANK